ncbi:uncharacterized protein BO97DRAFT_135973 [Aspergillus homomorphus CBS 101889]|uniref:Uncharacterized protein n=1 Tax=Aspergillus homomorphus (strain CBS 101889) TaxID=1450537 RepID=A0A395I8Z1_ASPHC|nr:hypothetical protein BO97DRAFT_135973 [Aspergillus homomorphus CBS 101889]RAL16501.1 hypothetical protein BO97DRAFT_135973 [Aspergillus homomorphus CBS 101889]
MSTKCRSLFRGTAAIQLVTSISFQKCCHCHVLGLNMVASFPSLGSVTCDLSLGAQLTYESCFLIDINLQLRALFPSFLNWRMSCPNSQAIKVSRTRCFLGEEPEQDLICCAEYSLAIRVLVPVKL